jgi:hypothetical protein
MRHPVALRYTEMNTNSQMHNIIFTYLSYMFRLPQRSHQFPFYGSVQPYDGYVDEAETCSCHI